MNSKAHSNISTLRTDTEKGSFVSRQVWPVFLFAIVTGLAAVTVRSDTIELRSPEQQQDAYFGVPMLGIADLTGDGMGELAVGALYYNDDGAVFILNGRDFSLVREISSPNPRPAGDSSQFGGALGVVPDANGDGIPELIVGATIADRPDLLNAGYGQVYVIDPTTGANLLTLSAPRPQRNTLFGNKVAALTTKTAGQVTRIAVSAPSGAGSAGRVHLYDAKSGELISSFSAPAPKSGDWFGSSLAAIGDVDGDGRVDLAVGSGNNNGESGSPGAAYLVSGETGQLLHPLIPPDLPAITPNRWSVAAVPDVNGDGRPDVLVGVPLASPPGAVSLAGRAYLFSGANGKWLRTVVSPEPQVRGFFGWQVAGLPDITGDGVSELLISGSGRPAIGTLGERRVHLINGATGQRIQSYQSPVDGEEFGASITGILDRNGKLRTIASGAGAAAAPAAPIRSGRGYAFPLSLSFLSASMSAEGLRLSLTATDDKSYDLQASSDLTAWTPLTTLKATAQPVTFLDREAKATNQRFYRAREANASP